MHSLFIILFKQMTFKFIYEPLNLLILLNFYYRIAMSLRKVHSETHLYLLFQNFLQIFFCTFDLKINSPQEFITQICVSLVMLFFTNHGSSSLYFSTVNVPSKQSSKQKEKEKIYETRYQKFLILVLCPNKMWQCCQQKSKCGR